ncbi:hypothetical protein COO60DRAFT_1117786 [Scenedesmus sp. NREL 46B-D3]|nr:hypothetical protein COO60DRAFT_1117786 [Scenedesmus sp. NREL 46B-D3]
MYALLNADSSAKDALSVHWASPRHIQAPCSDDGAATSHPQPPLSVLDALAAPTVFMQQALVFPKAIGAADLASALQLVLADFPALGYRLSQDQHGRLCLRPPAHQAVAGITLLQGTSPSTLQQLLQHGNGISSRRFADPTPPEHTPQQQQQQQQLVALPELPAALFGHLPGALLPAYLDDAELALVHVALVQLPGGGCVLGLRMSHLLGDWSSARLLLCSIAAAYSQVQQQQQQQQQQQHQQQQQQHAVTLQLLEVAAAAAAACHSCRS